MRDETPLGVSGRIRIAEAARMVGVSPSALRLWECQGLVSPTRGQSGQRLYSGDDVERLRSVHRLRRSNGLNAAGIRHLLGDASGPSGTAAVPSPTSDAAATGERLRTLRTRLGLSLREAAARADLSVSFISAVERGVTGASLAALTRLISAYGSTLGEVLRVAEPRAGRLVRPADRPVLDPGGGIRIEDLATSPTQLESQLFVLAPDASSDGYYAHQGEEFMYVLSGSLKVWLDDAEEYELAPGDALTFPSTLAHRFRALGPAETRLIWVNTPPTF